MQCAYHDARGIWIFFKNNSGSILDIDYVGKVSKHSIAKIIWNRATVEYVELLSYRGKCMERTLVEQENFDMTGMTA